MKHRDRLKETIQDRNTKSLKLDAFCDDFQKTDEHISEFSEELWLGLIDHVTVYRKKQLDFTFRNGQTIRI